jgi:hypothetical protein
MTEKVIFLPFISLVKMYLSPVLFFVSPGATYFSPVSSISHPSLPFSFLN